MSFSNENVIKIRATKPRNKELNEILMSRKPGPHKKRNKSQLTPKEIWREMNNA